MAGVVKTRGSLYFLRDLDYLTGQKGPYVKIGIVRKDKTTESRIKEHQTGNPRDIFDEHTLSNVPFVEALETQLHYHFNHLWIAGEWFHMDESFVKKEVLKEAKRLKKEQIKYEEQINSADGLSTQISNGDTCISSKAGLKLRDAYHQVKLNVDIADAKLKIAKSALLQAIGKVGFVEGIFHLTKSKDSISFDSSTFKKDKEALYDKYCYEKEGGFLKTFKVLGGTKLKDLDEALYNQAKALPKESYTPTHINKKKKRTARIESLHWAFLEAQRERKLLDWEHTKLEAQLKVSIGHYNAIDEVCTWERKQKDSTMAFDEDLFKEKEPKEYLKYLKVKIGSVLPKLELTRAYPTS
jgi:hypothetical protein